MISETLKKAPQAGVIAWLVRHDAELAYGDIMGEAARKGSGMSAPDGMIAAVARVNGSRLATRNLNDFQTTGLELISPWEF